MSTNDDYKPATRTLKDGTTFQVMQKKLDNSEWRRVAESKKPETPFRKLTEEEKAKELLTRKTAALAKLDTLTKELS